MTPSYVFESILSNNYTSTVLTFLILVFAISMFLVPFYVFRIYRRLGEVIKLQEEAKKRALKDLELRGAPTNRG